MTDPPVFYLAFAGRNVIRARVKIRKGQQILREKPLVIVPYWDKAKTQQHISDLIGKLPRDQVDKIHNIWELSGKRPSHYVYADILSSNSFNIRRGDVDERGMFKYLPHVSHSCRPTGHQSWDESRDCMFIYALTDIQIGEKITISYIDRNSDFRTCRETLQDLFHFACTCETCRLPPLTKIADDNIRQQIRELYERVDRRRTPEGNLADLWWLLYFVKEAAKEYADSRVADVHIWAFWILIGRGDVARASVFAQRAYEMGDTWFGDNAEWAQEKVQMESEIDYPTFIDWEWDNPKTNVP